MHCNFTDVLLLYYGHQHVSATHVAIFRVISLRTRTQIQLQCVWNNPSKKISGKNSLLNNKIVYGWRLQEYQKLKLSGVCRVMYFWFNWHILLNQMVVFVFSSFSFVFLWAYVDFACWALISLICSIFCALIRYIKCIKDLQMQI